MWPFKRKARKKRRSRDDLKAVVDQAAENGKKPEFDLDETTDVLDLALERTKRESEECQAKTRETIKDLKSMSSVRLPTPGGEEKVG